MTTLPRVGLLATHPTQYYAPWYRDLAKRVDLDVYYSHRQTATGQADAGFGVEFEWDVPLLEGYRHTFLENTASRPSVDRFFGCITPEIAPIIRDKQFDAFIVHGWGTASYWQAIRACWRTSTPIMVRGDSSLETPSPAWRRAIKYPIYRWFIPRFSAYLTVGTRAKHYLLHYGADVDRCFDSPHAIDNSRFGREANALRANPDHVRKEFGLAQKATVFLYVGKFIGLKRPELFVQALAGAAKVSTGVAGLMVGDGPLRQEMEGLAKSLNAPVTFTGFLNQRAIVRAYVAADVFVVSSDHETWCLAVNEAMACGVPTIVTDGVGCADDLVLPGQTGVRVPAGDAEALRRAMLSLHSDAQERSRLARRAFDHIQRFSFETATAGVVKAIERLRSSYSSTTSVNPSATAPVRGATTR